nr:BPSL0067 family protein [Geothrix alkalitolerans]
MQARFYVPWFGRFASPDPARDQHFEFTQSWNIYSYVRNNPIMSVDPTGMVEEDKKDEKKADGTRPGPNDRPGTAAKEVLPQPSAETNTDCRQCHTPEDKGAPKTWVTPTPDGGNDKGHLVDDGKGHFPGQCVSLVKKQSGAPSTGGWRKGAQVKGNEKLAPGTAIIAVKNGRNWAKGGHTGFYLKQDEKGLYMTDQFVTRGDHPVQTRFYPWQSGRSSFQSSGDNYYVLLTKP